MKLVNSTQVKKGASVEDRTFTLSQEAYEILVHSANRYEQDYATTLNAMLIILDGLMLDKGMLQARVVETDNTGVVTYMTNLVPTPRTNPTTPTRLESIRD